MFIKESYFYFKFLKFVIYDGSVYKKIKNVFKQENEIHRHRVSTIIYFIMSFFCSLIKHDGLF